jgi:hypothetical protein
MPLHVVHETHCPEIGPICAVRDEPPHLHDLSIHTSELRLTGEYGLVEHLSAEVQVPLRLTVNRIVYRRLDGTEFEPDYPNIHHRNETLFGIGDPWLAVRSGWPLSGFLVSGRLGVTLPLGSTEPDPFERGERGLEHQHIQFGTGTFNPVVGIEVARSLERWTFSGYGQLVLMLYENGHGYRAGHRVAGGLGVDYAIVTPLQIGASVDLVHEAPERWDGRIQQDGNLGRTDLLVGLAARYTTGPLSFGLSARLPAHQWIVHTEDEHAELSTPIILGLDARLVLGKQ